MRGCTTAVALGTALSLATLGLAACAHDDVPKAAALLSTAAEQSDAVPTAPETTRATAQSDDGPTSTETRGATAEPEPESEPESESESESENPFEAIPGAPEQPGHTIVKRPGPLPELRSIADPAQRVDVDRDCSPYSLERDYRAGTLTADDFTRYAVFGAWYPKDVPEQYRPCTDLFLLNAGAVFWSMQFVEYVDPALQKEVADFFTPTKVEPES